MKSLLAVCLLALGLPLIAAETNSTKPAVEAQKKETPAPSTNEVAVLKFAQGEIVVELFPDSAPGHVENFKKLIRQGFYDGTASHRLIPGFMIQLGDPNTKDPAKESQFGQGGPGYTIKAEFNKRKHVRGIVSMARTPDPDSAGSQFFICFKDAPNLDGQYTVFGNMIKGDDVLTKLEQAPQVRSKPVSRIGLESIKLVPRDSIK